MVSDDETPGQKQAVPSATSGENPAGSTTEEQEFARMLEESLEPQSFDEGETVEGPIVSFGRDVAFIDVGGKGEATIDLVELEDDEGQVTQKVGDRVKAVVVSTRGGLKLSHKLARGAASRERLGEAYQAGLPVEGRVEKSIKGGYEIRVGGQRAFCPISQIDTAFTEDPSVHVGQVYAFRIIEFKADGKDLVVSRRLMLKEEEQARAEEVRRTIVEDAVLPGKVASVQSYGAFVDLGGGIQGLLHVSEMGWSRVSDPAEVVSPGDEIQVKVLKLDREKGKISLGLKQLQADPWTTVEERYKVGQALTGRVTRVTEFGAFVELEPGIEALAHVSTFAPEKGRDTWKKSVPPGSSVAVELLSLDLPRRRIGVAVVEAGSAKDREAAMSERALVPTSAANARAKIVAGARVHGKVERHERYGIFVFLAPGRTGLIHQDEIGAEKGTDLKKTFPVGSDIEVMILEIEPSGKRIRLSRKAILEAEEKNEIRDYVDQQDQGPAESFGSLADKLRAAFQVKKE